MNRSYTFKSKRGGVFIFILFIFLHILTLIVNVGINETMLSYLNGLEASLMVAFISATTVSAMLNFLGMKYLIFNIKRSDKR